LEIVAHGYRELNDDSRMIEPIPHPFSIRKPPIARPSTDTRCAPLRILGVLCVRRCAFNSPIEPSTASSSANSASSHH
jgi:hypothetical protein